MTNMGSSGVPKSTEKKVAGSPQAAAMASNWSVVGPEWSGSSNRARVLSVMSGRSSSLTSTDLVRLA